MGAPYFAFSQRGGLGGGVWWLVVSGPALASHVNGALQAQDLAPTQPGG